ncbi:hypothetical protein CEXT_393381 [Caerostris extrusa]|uniref:Uncharacterized protein n=1 Tax=Caerostris extrusa TaxID=172846 RepID=A0AAV4NSP8_CAEEX|nr:hypothetical protein CEXT_393381 [Caerostris extrusa]
MHCRIWFCSRIKICVAKHGKPSNFHWIDPLETDKNLAGNHRSSFDEQIQLAAGTEYAATGISLSNSLEQKIRDILQAG